MKSVEYTRSLVEKTTSEKLAVLVADHTQTVFPWRVPLGKPTARELQADWEVLRTTSLGWRRLPVAPGLTITWEKRLVAKILQSIPTAVEFGTLDAAAAFAGPTQVAAVARARDRWATVDSRFPNTCGPAVLKTVLGWGEVDFMLGLDAAAWFRANPTIDDTWTARMVPVPGLHAKWLDGVGRRRVVAQLAGLGQLQLRERPAQAHLTYLDPLWRNSGGRRFDVITAGDTNRLPYPPRVVLVTENRDTALYFPPVPGGIALRGDGDRALRFLPELATTLPQIVYWGDIDTDGLEIVNDLRVRGVPVQTMLMDRSTYHAFQKFGTRYDRTGKPLACPERKQLPKLTAVEADLYDLLTDPVWTEPRRVEQERIPLAFAAKVLESKTAKTTD